MIDTPPLFDVVRTQAPDPAVSSRRPQAIRYGPCPRCLRSVARELDGEHLILRPHDVHTVGGASWQCRGSGQRVCAVWDQRAKQPVAQQCAAKCYRG